MRGASIIIFAMFVLATLTAGCASESKTNNIELAVEKCIEECRARVAKGENLEYGPCLSNRIDDDWVCDIAHDPRQEIDNMKENQCDEYGKNAHHFVEVDTNCDVIRIY
ncbi:MAG: hypothetical protein QXK37_04735 [Candidatus Woesearchaeota archaeon]